MRNTTAWLTEAAKLPLGFAQVREDPTLDQAVAHAAGERVSVIMVASGGCTAAALAASPRVAWLHLVDPNPSQIALARVKLRLLESTPPAQRLAVLGHAPMQRIERREWLGKITEALGLPPEIFGPADLVAELGVDHAGRYERLFARLREEISGHAEAIERLLELTLYTEENLR